MISQRRAVRQQSGRRSEFAAAVECDVAARRQRLARQIGRRAGQRLHRQIVGHQNSLKADPAADDRLDHRRRQCRRQGGVPGGIDDVRRHGPGQVGVQGERQQIGIQVVRLDPRQRQMAVDARAAMAGRVLPDRLNAGGEQPRCQRAPQRRHLSRLPGQGPIADDRVRTGYGKVEHRRGNHIETGRGAIQADQGAGQPRRAQVAQGRSGRMGAPVRRTQPRHAATFLIHHQHRVRWQDPAQLGDQCRKLRGCYDIAREQNDATGRGGAEQRRLIGRQGGSGDPDDCGLQKSATEQAAPLARTFSQNDVAWGTSTKPPVRTRHKVRPSRSILLIAGRCEPSNSGKRLDRRSHSDFAASSVRTAASWTTALFPAGAATRFSGAGSDGFADTTGFVGVVAIGGGGDDATAGAGIGVGAATAGDGGARKACGAGDSGGGASLPVADSVPPDRMSSFAPATCMPPGLSGFTRIGRFSACTTGTVVLPCPSNSQPPTTTINAAPRPPAISANRRVPGSIPWRRRGTR